MNVLLLSIASQAIVFLSARHRTEPRNEDTPMKSRLMLAMVSAIGWASALAPPEPAAAWPAPATRSRFFRREWQWIR